MVLKKPIIFILGMFCLLFFWRGGPLLADQVGGVGVLLDHDPRDAKCILIFSVTYKSPADKAKIHRGDRLLKVDGVEIGGMNLQDIGKKIIGPVGSTVSLTVQSPQGSVREVPIVRAAVSQGPAIALPPPSTISTGAILTLDEKNLVKQKIMALTTDVQRQRMAELLIALKQKDISKAEFMKLIKEEFP